MIAMNQPDKKTVQLVWLKKDLRLHDHRPLQEASATHIPALVFYLFEPSVMADPHHSNRHWTFVWQSLQEMRRTLSSYGVSLWILKMEAIDFFHAIQEIYDIQHLVSHEETGLDVTYQRDLAVAEWCASNEVMWRESPSNGVHRGLMHRNGWRKRWADRMALPLFDPDLDALTGADLPESLVANQVTMEEILAFPGENGTNEAVNATSQNSKAQGDAATSADASYLYLHDIQKGGESEAWRTLNHFLEDRAAYYSASISAPGPARIGCSRMSPYITWGNISIKQIQWYVSRGYRAGLGVRANTQGLDGEKVRAEEKVLAPTGVIAPAGKRGIRSFQSRLGWHCHFIQKLEAEPRMEFENLNRGYDDIRQEKNAMLLKAWEEGQTGYPMVDASMRSLNATGYLNFRMRAMLVSFLTHHLWLDWRDGSPHLARQFLDFEPGIHFSQFQMQAGTMGVNTIRIYNPVKQGKDHDPEGRFVREWVPELREVPGSLIHEPWLMSEMEQMMAGCRIGVDYPQPVVPDLKASYRRASDQLWAKKGESLVKRENLRIMKTHVKNRGDGKADGS